MAEPEGSNVYSKAPAYVKVEEDDLLLMPPHLLHDEVMAAIKRRKHQNSDWPGSRYRVAAFARPRFSLGEMQAFASEDVFKHFDYRSTVSGGGYSGSCLTWAMYGKPDTTDKERLEFIKCLNVGSNFSTGTDDPNLPIDTEQLTNAQSAKPGARPRGRPGSVGAGPLSNSYRKRRRPVTAPL